MLSKQFIKKELIILIPVITVLGIFGIIFLGLIAYTGYKVVKRIAFDLADTVCLITESINNQGTGERFYIKHAGWDFSRIPLVYPYHLISVVKNEWTFEDTVPIEESKIFGEPSPYNIDKFTLLSPGIMIVKEPETSLENDESSNKGYQVFIFEGEVFRKFSNEQEVMDFLAQNQVEVDSLDLKTPSEWYQEFDNKGRLPWYPEGFNVNEHDQTCIGFSKNND
jgi:hypothetical protein